MEKTGIRGDEFRPQVCWKGNKALSTTVALPFHLDTFHSFFQEERVLIKLYIMSTDEKEDPLDWGNFCQPKVGWW